MIVKTIVRGRRTIYQLRDKGTILTAASADYLDFLNRNNREDDGDKLLKRLCYYRKSKQEQLHVIKQ